VAPEGTAGAPAFCADAAPTAATIAHTEPPRLNSFRTDLNTERPPNCTRTIEVAFLHDRRV
jgi:hypothetical protein